MVKQSEFKVIKAITATEAFLAGAENKEQFTDRGGFTIYGCEVRNLKYYKEMVGVDKRKLTGFHRELYKAI